MTYIFFNYSFSQTCNDNCGNGSLQMGWASDCVCSLDCSWLRWGMFSDFYDVCFDNPSNLVFEDFVVLGKVILLMIKPGLMIIQLQFKSIMMVVIQ